MDSKCLPCQRERRRGWLYLWGYELVKLVTSPLVNRVTSK
jgi:hypothetical protein